MKTRKWETEVVGTWPFTQYVTDKISGETIAKFGMIHFSTKDKTVEDILTRDSRNMQVFKDAQLSASAPNLLENLIRCVDRLEENGLGDMSAVTRAKAAIKEAVTTK